MKTLIIITAFLLPAFLSFNCSRDIKIDCPDNLSVNDFTGTYQAEKIETYNACDTGRSNNAIITDSLNYFLELNNDWTGKIYGPDTLTDFEWIFENIASSSGSSGGCYQTFTLWTRNRKIRYNILAGGEIGIGFYETDSTWNYKHCERQKFYFFKRIE